MHLNSVQEIERAIDALTPEQIEELYAWLDRRHPQPIDAQLKPILTPGAWTTINATRFMKNLAVVLDNFCNELKKTAWAPRTGRTS